MKYSYSEIEKKWRARWKTNPINKPDVKKPKFYCLDMFPYPSGSGLHVGHWRGYVLSDVLSRYKVMQGFEVLHPMGWDAFGLPAENYAIKNGLHPAKATEDNVATYTRQLKEISAIYDWNREINTTDPGYYKWTQWIFAEMFKKGLAYEKEMPLNWCPECKCVLANEEATGGECDRCGSVITKKMLRQWMLKITAYADRLLDDLDKLDWPDKVKKMQSDWIGRSSGADVVFKLEQFHEVLHIYTTRSDTLFGVTFMVLAPEHPLVAKITTPEHKAEMDDYVFRASTKSSVDRMTDKEKTGVFTGSYAINPLSGEKIPVWVSDYVLIDYGTGAIMCVPGHDERDFAFAKKFGLKITQVVSKDGSLCKLEEAYIGDGVLVNSREFDGLKTPGKAIETLNAYLEKNGIGKASVNYKLRDWVFSRQRYWGEPIPIIHCSDCGAVPVPEKDLPVLLPDVESYLPTDTGESPLAAIEEWVNTVCPVCQKPAKRETNTMPQWAGSSWYFLRYADPNNTEVLAGTESIKTWLPVDYYVGGIEHAVLHLLYSRFYTKFLCDIGLIDFDEPFTKLFNQGMISRNGHKMAKSKGNIVSPDDLVSRYGCDSLRMYELFIAPPELDTEWDDSGIDGVFRYLNKLWRFVYENRDTGFHTTHEMDVLHHKAIFEITQRLDSLSLNTVISGFMEYTNKIIDQAREQGGVDPSTLETLVVLLAPFAPHIAEELWEQLGHSESVFNQSWPICDESKMAENTVEIGLQINGKFRDNMKIPADYSSEDAIAAAKEKLKNKLLDVTVVKEIYVPKRIVNLVVKG